MLVEIFFKFIIFRNDMLKKYILVTIVFLSMGLAFTGCSTPLPWPESPLYEFPEHDAGWNPPPDLEAAKQALVGHYAHYDVVAYEDAETQTPMRTFIVSYGFTDFFIEDGVLYQSDRFVRAKQKINQRNIISFFSDEAVQAIKPRTQQVELNFVNGEWHIFRPSTPTLLGITGDPSLPLSRDRNDPNLIDPDGDGNPGVTVKIEIGGLLKGELYITRREIFNNYLTLGSDGILYGHVVDLSEQFVLGASMKILDQPSNPIQHADYGLSPLMLVPISEDLDTLEELMAHRDRLFPEEPEFPR